MPTQRQTLLCRYHYDPLDRLADCTPTAQTSSQRFYLKDRLATEIQGALQRSIMQHEDQLLAQHQRQNGTAQPRLLATDQQRSVLAILNATRSHNLAYTPYGHRLPENGLLSLLGFNGERPDPVTGHYLLGNGYRAFNPVLMRFNSPDSWSPFGEGGFNSYAYCYGNPGNKTDPSGHTPIALWAVLRKNLKFLINKGEQITTLVRRPLRVAGQATKRSAADAFEQTLKEIPIQKVVPSQRAPVLTVQPTPPRNLQNSIANQTANSAAIANRSQTNPGTSALTTQNTSATSPADTARNITIRTLTDSGYSEAFIINFSNREIRVTPSSSGDSANFSPPRNSGSASRQAHPPRPQ